MSLAETVGFATQVAVNVAGAVVAGQRRARLRIELAPREARQRRELRRHAFDAPDQRDWRAGRVDVGIEVDANL